MNLRQVAVVLGSPFSPRLRMKRSEDKERDVWTAAGFSYDTISRGAIIIPETRTIYLPVSKAANTSIKILFASHAPHSSQDIHKYPNRFGLQRLRDLSETPMALLGPESAWRKFTIVRHPVDRFLSAYRDKISRNSDTPLRKCVAEYHNRAVGADLPISDVLTYIENTPTHAIEEHVRPQWSCNGAPLISFDAVGKVEDLGQSLRELQLQGFIPAGLDLAVGRFNSTSNEAPGDAKYDLSKEQLDRIVQIYRRDFEVFDYSIENV